MSVTPIVGIGSASKDPFALYDRARGSNYSDALDAKSNLKGIALSRALQGKWSEAADYARLACRVGIITPDEFLNRVAYLSMLRAIKNRKSNDLKTIPPRQRLWLSNFGEDVKVDLLKDCEPAFAIFAVREQLQAASRDNSGIANLFESLGKKSQLKTDTPKKDDNFKFQTVPEPTGFLTTHKFTHI